MKLQKSGLAVMRPVAFVLAGLLAVLGVNANATTAYDSIVSAVDWSAVSTATITIFAAGAAVMVVFVGGKFLLRAIRGA